MSHDLCHSLVQDNMISEAVSLALMILCELDILETVQIGRQKMQSLNEVETHEKQLIQ